MKLLNYIISLFSFGGFTNKKEWKKHPFAWQNANELAADRKRISEVLGAKECSQEATDLVLEAFDFFKKNPQRYDGASGDVELDKIGNVKYDLAAMPHDLLDALEINYTTSIQRIKKGDKMLIKLMEEMGAPSIHIDKRKFVTLLSRLRFALSKKRRNSGIVPDTDLVLLVHAYTLGYHIDYKPLYKYGAILLILLILIATHPFVWWLIRLF
jgi:hypothetical protein